MTLPFLLTATSAEGLLLNILLLGGLIIAVVVVAAVATVGLVLPGGLLREALRHGSDQADGVAVAMRKSIAQTRLLAFARRLMAYGWSEKDVIVTTVFVLTSTAGILAFLVSGYVLGISRPTLADGALPWFLAVGLFVSMAWAWERRRVDPWLALAVIVCDAVGLVLVALLKGEATAMDPAIYLNYHPWKDQFLTPAWIALEAGLLGGSALAHEGWAGAVHAVGEVVGLLIEAVVAVFVLAVWLGEWLVRGVLLGSRLLLGILLMPGELLYRAFRSFVGTDQDGNHRLPPPSGGALA